MLSWCCTEGGKRPYGRRLVRTPCMPLRFGSSTTTYGLTMTTPVRVTTVIGVWIRAAILLLAVWVSARRILSAHCGPGVASHLLAALSPTQKVSENVRYRAHFHLHRPSWPLCLGPAQSRNLPSVPAVLIVTHLVRSSASPEDPPQGPRLNARD